eukprot:CAMPEP_0178941296 /NCGR_PEP_ID=MMETSP0789-20121207/1322_1 /TAXON_ID=3005 /ORGANISM="Rhizosolenia setigera, Strain CCMP 1694" /LENGTH=150 /DNA_ID=CAMNT_0020620503 /DNA_START=77 /DNA_END=529 /DNA_ORIENTATION=+
MASEPTTDEYINIQGKFIFSLEFDTLPPIVAGSRVVVGIKPGGPARGRINGQMIAPSSDWITLKSNGSIALDVNVVIKTNDGHFIYQKMVGYSIREVDNPSNSIIRSSAMFETSAEPYKWLNNMILLGHGTKQGSKIKVNYYDTKDPMAD